MNKQRKVVITTTYNEMGIIIDTKAEEVVQPEPHEDVVSRQEVIDKLYDWSNHSMTDAEAWHLRQVIGDIKSMPSAQPETAKRIVGKSRDGMTLWYQCDMCNEPVNLEDSFCSGCGRRLTDG